MEVTPNRMPITLKDILITYLFFDVSALFLSLWIPPDAFTVFIHGRLDSGYILLLWLYGARINNTYIQTSLNPGSIGNRE